MCLEYRSIEYWLLWYTIYSFCINGKYQWSSEQSLGNIPHVSVCVCVCVCVFSCLLSVTCHPQNKVRPIWMEGETQGGNIGEGL